MFDVNEIRKDFPMLQGKTMNGHPLAYLDNSATTLKPRQVIEAVNHFYCDITANAHRGDYELSQKVDQLYEETRKIIARMLNCDPLEVAYTSGTTYGVNQVAWGYVRTHLNKGDVILITEAEHASNVLPWFRLADECGFKIEYIPLNEEGRLTIENFKKALHEGVRFVAVAEIGNVLGYRAPVKEMCRLAHEIGARMLVDGAQSVPHGHTDVKDMDCDFLCFSAHKMCGPSGMGVMYGKSELLKETEPLCLGGGSNARFFSCGDVILKESPYKFESGTQNIEGIMGMGAAASYLMDIGFDNIAAHERELRNYLVSQLEKLDNVILYNPKGDSGIVTFNVKGIFSQDAAGYLASQGIAVRSGNHCAKILVDFLKTDDTIRSSLYFYNTKEDVDALVEAVRTCTIENCIGIFF